MKLAGHNITSVRVRVNRASGIPLHFEVNLYFGKITEKIVYSINPPSDNTTWLPLCIQHFIAEHNHGTMIQVNDAEYEVEYTRT